MGKNRYIGLEDLEEINKQNEQMKKNNKRKKREKRSIFERFSTKENIIIFSFLLIFLIIGWGLIKKYNPFETINYNKSDINTFLANSTSINDRDTYWILNDIVLNLLYSSTGNNISSNGESTESNLYYKFSTSEYYNALTSDYKKFLSEDEYINLMGSVIQKYRKNYENLTSATNETPIRKIYKYTKANGEYYIIKLNTSIETFIGIQLFREESKFNIFYLE